MAKMSRIQSKITWWGGQSIHENAKMPKMLYHKDFRAAVIEMLQQAIMNTLEINEKIVSAKA